MYLADLGNRILTHGYFFFDGGFLLTQEIRQGS